MSELESELMSKCKALYEAMEANTQESPEGIFWIGALTTLLKNVSGPGASSNYSQVVGALTDMGCIEQIRKGGGKAPSAWRLLHPPDSSLVTLIKGKRSSHRSSKAEQVDQEIATLNQRINNLERELRAVVKYLEEQRKASKESEDG